MTGPYRDVTPATSGLYEKCARHTSPQGCRLLQTIYVCDDCARQLVAEAFNARPPVYHGETLQGFCGLCNIRRDVTMRQWFACGPCWNVVLGHQKSVASSAAIADWWSKDVRPHLPHLELVETEPMYLSPYTRKGKTKKQAATTVAKLDFLVSDTSTGTPVPMFHIEQKAGPTSIASMTEFQLDVNDYNDIVGAVYHTGLPAYVIHVEAIANYAFPTRQIVAESLWWTDIHTLSKNQKAVRKRRNEDKKAIYYKPAAFEPIETLAPKLTTRSWIELAARLDAERLDLI